jgi:hypothetical protein
VSFSLGKLIEADNTTPTMEHLPILARDSKFHSKVKSKLT